MIACNPKKETVASRGMQNLTARYNILYNANLLVDESERNIQQAYPDNFERLISVYEEPDETLSQSEIKKLDDAILKANAIVNEKSQSKYVDEAYFLIGKANHLKANFFNAVEFFSYVYNTFPKEKEIKQAALAWKARSLMELERFEEAETTLDTALKHIGTEKKSAADVYAARAQLHIYAKQDEDAIILLKKAIDNAGDKSNAVRWAYVLAQLQQITGKPEDAYANYSTVLKSNAPFEMAFNANLNRIGIEDEQSGRVVSREERLRSLLKDDKNKDFIDQIYFQIGESFTAENEIEKAIENYNKAISNSARNQNQKGLTYLRLADIYFKQGNYTQSKAYYDSTLTALPPNYPDYERIQKKGSNLELLADRLSIIAREDELQKLAGLPEPERDVRIGELVREQAEKALAGPAQNGTSANPFFLNNDRQSAAIPVNNGGKFYFNNSTALSQGFSDFKRRWGNRKLEDNWRRSQKSTIEAINPISDNPDGITAAARVNPDNSLLHPDSIRQNYLENIPLTPAQRLTSDERVATAYYDIGNYYREVLNDDREAINAFETLLKRHPDNKDKLAVYYNLYRLYANVDPVKSAEYKNILLTEYPASSFAKVILNPGYSQQTDEQEMAINQFYDDVYAMYVSKNYPEVGNRVEQAQQKFGINKLSPQLAYLNALAIGHTQKLPELEKALIDIVNGFPGELLIVPLVQQHLRYIDLNRDLISKRAFAIVDFDPNEPPFIEEPINEPVIAAKPNQPVVAARPGLPTAVAGEEKPALSTPENPESAPENPAIASAETNSFFTLAESTEYYYVVNVTDPSVNLSSSRFGIGQFNRANYTGSGIKHQLKAANNQNQLIFTGIFSSREAVADYSRNITPLMPEIMKIPASKYVTFFISKQNLDKLTDRETIDRYIEFYQKNY